MFMSYYEEDGSPDDDTIVIGELLADIDSNEGYIPTTVIDTEPSLKLNKIKEKMNINSPIKIIVGTRCC